VLKIKIELSSKTARIASAQFLSVWYNETMSEAKPNAFFPDYAVPPGATLREALGDSGMSTGALAAGIGSSGAFVEKP